MALKSFQTAIIHRTYKSILIDYKAQTLHVKIDCNFNPVNLLLQKIENMHVPLT